MVYRYNISYTAGSKHKIKTLASFEDSSGLGNGFIISQEIGIIRIFVVKQTYANLTASTGANSAGVDLKTTIHCKNEIIQAVYVNTKYAVAIDVSNRIVWWDASQSLLDHNQVHSSLADDPAPLDSIQRTKPLFGMTAILGTKNFAVI